MAESRKKIFGRWAIAGLLLVGLIQLGLQIRFGSNNFDVISDLEPLAFVVAFLFEAAALLILAPTLVTFYQKSGIKMPPIRGILQAFTGISVSRTVPFGEYVVFRILDGPRKIAKRISSGYTVVLYTWMITGLLILLIGSQTYTFLTLPADNSDVFDYGLLIILSTILLIVLAVVLIKNNRYVREKLGKFAEKHIGTRTFWSPTILSKLNYSKGDYLELLASSMISWLCNAAVLQIMLWQFGQPAPFVLVMFGYAVVRMIVALPFLPGGIGEDELGTTLFFTAFGYDPEAVLAAVIAFRVFDFWLPLLVGMGSLGVMRRQSVQASRI